MDENDPNQPAEMPSEETQEKQFLVIRQPIEEELQKSYLDYAMSVIVGRALPDVRDGLKPVHRRILYGMSDLSLKWNQSFKKCARIVGEVLGKYHPHGDQSVYDALVRMGQDFSLRYPLVDGQGNFGSLDGDPPAAMRYTEARLAKISDEMLSDLDKDTVDTVPNFDGSLEEPSVLPAKTPGLLINGSSGIAVGMATNIPPHNIKETCQAAVALIENPEIEPAELMQVMPGPDFPTGAIVQGNAGIHSYFTTGRGKIRMRAVMSHETTKSGKNRIIITEIPYMINKSDLIKEIAKTVKEKRVDGISDIVDESDRKGMRIVIDLKKDANPEIVENLLMHHTRLVTTMGVIMLAIVDGQPKVMGVKEVLEHYIVHRRIIVRRRTDYDLLKAQDKAHLLEGLVTALDHIDPIVALLKKAKNSNEGRDGLMTTYSLSEKQANAILEMRLSKLTGLEQDKIREELKITLELIEDLKNILSSEQNILNIIRDELLELIEKYGDERRTQILEGGDDNLDIEDLIDPEDVVVTISDEGYCKRIPVDTYRAQHRGGKGIIGTRTKDEDFVRHLFVANTHTWLMIFTDMGRVYWTKVYKIPPGSRTSKGRPIINIVNVQQDEHVRAVIPVREFTDDRFLMFVTKKGTVKKTVLSAYGNIRQTGIIAIKLDEDDNLVDVLLTTGQSTVMLATARGMAIRFSGENVRPMGRVSRGVRGIRLAKKDRVVDALVIKDETKILSITENGYGKRTNPDEYRLINRGGKGVRNIITDERNGEVAAVKRVRENEDIMVMTKNGITIRTPVEGIRIIGRNTKGVKIMNLKNEDKVMTCTVVQPVDEVDLPDEPDDEPETPTPPEKSEVIETLPETPEDPELVVETAEEPEEPEAADEPEADVVEPEVEESVEELDEPKEDTSEEEPREEPEPVETPPEEPTADEPSEEDLISEQVPSDEPENEEEKLSEEMDEIKDILSQLRQK